ncbi:MAG: pyridoxamine 5'-phosphate oxidase family protein [bacterium]|nr:pyridoxamine 5'-phosphate oxidase family protein [bacterium]
MNNHDELQKAIQFVERCSLAALATISPEGVPYASAIHVVVDVNLSFYFVTKAETAKWEHIQRSPLVALVITNDDTRQTLQVQGLASSGLTTELEISIINKFAAFPEASLHPEWKLPSRQLTGGEYVIVKIEPTWARLASFQGNKPVFMQIV